MTPESIIEKALVHYGRRLTEEQRKSLTTQLLLFGGETVYTLLEGGSLSETAYRLALLLQAPPQLVEKIPSLREVGELLLQNINPKELSQGERQRRMTLMKAVDRLRRNTP